jgi:hypothetical protein
MSHLGVEVHENYVRHGGIFQDFPDGDAVAATEHEHIARPSEPGQARVHQRFVVAVFVA